MRATTVVSAIFCASLSCANVLAQDFPEGSTPLAEGELKKRISDTVFDVKIADGTTWRLEYKSSGYFFVDTSRGLRANGKWFIQDGKLCGQLQGRDQSCNELRLSKDVLHMKRDNGEVIQLVPR